MSESTPSEPVDILLVEDNPGDVRLTQEAFKEAGIANRIHVVTDGYQALEFLYQRGEYEDAVRPDLVLLDLNLPKKNGDEVLEELKADPQFTGLPVIVLTSSDAETDVVRSYELNANAYLTKPVNPGEFVETVRTLERFWLSIVRLPTDDER